MTTGPGAAPAPDALPVPLGVDAAPALLALCALALPDEVLTLDDLEGVVFGPSGDAAGGSGSDGGDPPSVRRVDAATFALPGADGTPLGAVSVSMSELAGIPSAHLQLLVVHPARRRRGIARSLVRAAESWAQERGASSLTVGAGAPFYLFTGVDTRWTDALCCWEALGYERVAAELDLVCPTVPPRSAQRGSGPARPMELGHVADAHDAAALDRWVREHYPHWAAEFARAADAGTVVVARDERSGALLGAAAHSVSRFAVIGPVAVSASEHGHGIGARLMAEVLADLSIAGSRSAEIAWTSTVRFYARACDARVGRTSVVLRRELGA